MAESVVSSLRAFRAVAGALGAAALLGVLAGCASKRDCGCGTGPERVWVPPHTETRLEYAMIPAATRMRTVEVPCIQREPVTVSYEEPVYETVRVADTRRALAPTTECVTVPKIGYERVQDTRPVVRSVCQMQCQPTCKCATVIELGIGMGCDGFHVVADARREMVTKYERKRVKIGEKIVEIPAGCHLEEIQVGCEKREVAVGAHEVTCTGHHLEQQQVGTECRTVVVGQKAHVVVGRTYQEAVVTRPAHWGTQEVPVEVPGWWATITCDPAQSNGHDVLTRAEYEALKVSLAR